MIRRQLQMSAATASKLYRHVPIPLVRTEGMNVVFVGTEPGSESLRRGVYYADPTNGFYRHLAQAAFTPRQLVPTEFRDLPGYEIGARGSVLPAAM